MANPLVKQKATRSQMEKYMEQAVHWIEHNQETFWGVVGGVVLIGAFLGFVIHQRSVSNTDAWMKLGAIQSEAMQSKFSEESKNLDDWETHFSGSSAASYAKFLRGDLLSKTSDYAGAAAIYNELSQTASPIVMRPLALAAESSAEEMAGHLPQALTIAQHFTDQYPDHFLAGSMYFAQARLSEETGNKAAASALYDRIVLLYPQSPWTALAHSRIQALSPPGTAPAAASAPPGLSAAK